MKMQFPIMAAIAALVFASLACQAVQPTAVAVPTLAILPSAPAAPTQDLSTTTVPSVLVPTVVTNNVVSDSPIQQDILPTLYNTVLPGATQEEAVQIAERVRHGIETADIHIQEGKPTQG